VKPEFQLKAKAAFSGGLLDLHLRPLDSDLLKFLPTGRARMVCFHKAKRIDLGARLLFPAATPFTS
jgi:hypothetical protein